MEIKPVNVQCTVSASTQATWNAITDKDQMRQWYFPPIEDFQPKVDFETAFDVECDGKLYRHVWRVTEVEPPQRIAYAWRYEGIPGNSVVLWQLSETDGGTLVEVCQQATEPFPEDDPIFSAESALAGWNYLTQNLKDYLEKQ